MSLEVQGLFCGLLALVAIYSLSTTSLLACSRHLAASPNDLLGLKSCRDYSRLAIDLHCDNVGCPDLAQEIEDNL